MAKKRQRDRFLTETSRTGLGPAAPKPMVVQAEGASTEPTVTLAQAKAGLQRSGVTMPGGQRIDFPVTAEGRQGTEKGMVRLGQPGMAAQTRKARLGFAVSAEKAGIDVPTADPRHPYAGQSGAQGGLMKVMPDSGLEGDFGPGAAVPPAAFLRIRAEEGAQREATRTGEYQTLSGGMGGSLLTHIKPETQLEEVPQKAGTTVAVPPQAREDYGRIASDLDREVEVAAPILEGADAFSAMTLPEQILAKRRVREKLLERMSPEDRQVVDLIEKGTESKALTKRYAVPHPLSPAAAKKPKVAKKPTRTPAMERQAAKRLVGTAKSLRTSSQKSIETAKKILQAAARMGATGRKTTLAESGPIADYAVLREQGIGEEEAIRTAFNIGPEDEPKALISPSIAAGKISNLVWGEVDPEDPKKVLRGGWDHDNRSQGDPAKAKKHMRQFFDIALRRNGPGGRGFSRDEVIRMFGSAIANPPPRLGFTDTSLTTETWEAVRKDLKVPIQRGERTAGKLAERKADERRQATAGKGSMGEDIPAKTAPPEQPTVENLLAGKYDGRPDVAALQAMIESRQDEIRAMSEEQILALKNKINQLGLRPQEK